MHICTLYDIGNQDGIDFLVMEFLQGETLSRVYAATKHSSCGERFQSAGLSALADQPGRGVDARRSKALISSFETTPAVKSFMEPSA
jgi:hypothetical protein